MAMHVCSSCDTALSGLHQLEGADDKRMALQVSLLKKTLQVQQEQADEMRRMMEGKGTVVDMRV